MKKSIKELILYAVVGGIATIAEWIIFYICDSVLSVHYIPATAAAYLISTFVNWLAGRLLVFREGTGSLVREIGGIYLAAIAGLVLNVIIMSACVDGLSMGSMISKIIATGLVFFFNYFVRKLIIYKNPRSSPGKGDSDAE